jgi:hypothetical protein
VIAQLTILYSNFYSHCQKISCVVPGTHPRWQGFLRLTLGVSSHLL